MAVVQTGDNKWAVCKYIVDPVAGLGTSQTITAAMASAVSGDVIAVRQGTYTEDFTITPGVTLTTMGGSGKTPAVTIVGKVSMTGAGTSTIYGIRLQTNSDFAIAVTGIAASVLNVVNCFINCTNNTGISFASSSASSFIEIKDCTGNLGTTGIAVFAHSSSGRMELINAGFGNSGLSTTANTCSSGIVNGNYSRILNPLTLSGTALAAWEHCILDPSAAPINAIALTAGGSGIQIFKWCRFGGGTSSAVTISTTLTLEFCDINSSNANAITGAGTINIGSVTFTGSSSTINTSTVVALVSNMGTLNLKTPLTVANGGTGLATLTANSIQIGNGTSSPTQLAVGATGTVLTGVTASNPAFSATPSVTSITLSGGTALSTYAEGTFTPTMIGVVAGTTTYTNQIGYYTRIGNMVTVFGLVTGSAATGTGDIVYGGLPFTVKNQGGGAQYGAIVYYSARTFPIGSTYVNISGVINSITAKAPAVGTALGALNMQMANIAFNDQYTFCYQI